jgi:hypothetical protein
MEDNIRMDLREKGKKLLDWMHLDENGYLVNTVP